MKYNLNRQPLGFCSRFQALESFPPCFPREEEPYQITIFMHAHAVMEEVRSQSQCFINHLSVDPACLLETAHLTVALSMAWLEQALLPCSRRPQLCSRKCPDTSHSTSPLSYLQLQTENPATVRPDPCGLMDGPFI